MPAFAVPVLIAMMAIAKKMPARETSYPEYNRKVPKRTNNRVHQSARLLTISKDSFVTGQSSKTGNYTRKALAKYTVADKGRPSFSTHLIQGNTDCQKLLQKLSIKKDRMNCQLEYLQLEATTAVNRALELSMQLQHVNNMIRSNGAIIASSPLCLTTRKLEHRNAKLYCKKLQLEDRLQQFNAAAMLLRACTINIIVKQLAMLEGLMNIVKEIALKLNKNDFVIVPGLMEKIMPVSKLSGSNVLQQRA